MVLFDSSYLKIEFRNVPCRHLVTFWLGMPVKEMLQEGIRTILKCCDENDVRKLLNDTRFQENISDYDENLTDEAISQYALRHGLMHHAVVISKEVFLKFCPGDFEPKENTRNHIKQFFANEKDAVTWLQEVDFK